MNDCILFIESNTTGTGIEFMRAVKRRGYEPILLAASPNRYGFAEKNDFKTITVDTSSPSAISSILSSIIYNHRVLAVLSSSDYFVHTAARIAKDLNLFGVPPEAIMVCRNKLSQRQTLAKHRLPQPLFYGGFSIEDATNALKRISCPCILKPIEGSGKNGVLLALSHQEAISHAKGLAIRMHNERGNPVSPGFLIEEYAEGPEFSIETIGDQPIGVTEKISGPPNFIEMGHNFPADIPQDQAEIMIQIALKAVRCLGLAEGPAHTEIRWTNRGPSIIEVNPRLAGGMIPMLIFLSKGIDLFDAAVSIACGEQPDLTPKCDLFAAIRFLVPTIPGRLLEIEGEKTAKTIPGVEDVRFYSENGKIVGGHGDFRDRIAHVIATGASRDAAVASVEKGISSLKPTVDQNTTGDYCHGKYR